MDKNNALRQQHLPSYQAIDYSDGVIEANRGVAPELLAHASNKKVPLLNFPGDDFMDAYAAFYEKIYPTTEE